MALRRAIERRLRITATRWPMPGSVSHHLRHLLKFLSVDCVVDVGANDGQFARLLREEVGYSGRIASVEPGQAAAARLRVAAAPDPLWTVHEFALGERPGEADLFTFEGDATNSLHWPSTAGTLRLGFESTGTERVQVRRLDECWHQLVGEADRVFVKVDAQGHDVAVIAGLGQQPAVGLLVELSVEPLYEGAPTLEQGLSSLRNAGWTPTGFFPVSRDVPERMRLVEVDVAFMPAKRVDRHD